MNDPEIVDVHIIDGPLAGTVKYLDKRELLVNRTLKFYIPMPFTAQKQLDDSYTIKCTQAEYIFIQLPSSYHRERYVALHQNAGLGN